MNAPTSFEEGVSFEACVHGFCLSHGQNNRRPFYREGLEIGSALAQSSSASQIVIVNVVNDGS